MKFQIKLNVHFFKYILDFPVFATRLFNW